MQAIYRVIDAVSQNKSTVLLSGESGTGKELVARTIHQRGILRDMPFVAINCAGLSETLLDSQLFGHRRGAFTGAVADHDGVFRAATGGTLVPRRGRRDPARAAGEVPARHPGARGDAARLEPARAGRRPPDRRHQPRPRDRGARRHVPRRSLLSPERRAHRAAAAARAPRRHPAAGRSLPRALLGPVRRGAEAHRARRAGRAGGVRLARATSASCRTPSSAPSRCRPPT